MWIIIVISLVFTGCVAIDTQLQPENELVHAVLNGQDCSPIIFGFGFGTNTWSNALHAGNGAMIQKVRTAQFKYVAAFGFGSQCLELIGDR
jgi:hypothetical protein